MGIIELTRFKKVAPIHAEGRVCLELTDPITKKVKERVRGKNHVFTDALFAPGVASGEDWIKYMNTVWLCLNNSTAALDTTFPYLLGQTIGYGIPTQGSLGLYRGAYNSANQVLGACSATKVYWKYQYEFTTNQANGTIRNIGLTSQYKYGVSYATWRHTPKDFFVATQTTNPEAYQACTNDGSACYKCTTAGVITKYDILTATTATIDVSATVGTSGNKCVGYAPATGKYYVWSSGNKTMYMFSNNAFTTLENSYPASSITISYSNYPLYIYGGFAYWFYNYDSIYKADFINNIAQAALSITSSDSNNATITESGSITSGNMCYQSMGVSGKKYAMSLSCYGAKRGLIIDLENGIVAGCVIGDSSSSSQSYPVFNPPNTALNVCAVTGGVNIIAQPACTTYILETPFTKTSANGMTASYELEVFW